MEFLAAAVSLFTSLFNFFSKNMEHEAAKAAAKRAVGEAYGLDVPAVEDLLTKAEQQGIQPDVEQGDTRQDQINALRQMSDIGAKGGMDEGSLAALQQAGARTAQMNQQARQGIQGEFQRRGQWGSGQELANQLGAIQSSANTLSMAGTQAAADARARALQAIAASGQMSGQIRGQDEELALANKAAREARDRFNAELRQNTNQFNSQARDRQYGMQSDRAGRINQATGNYTAVLEGKNAPDLTDVGKAGVNAVNAGYQIYKGG